MSRPRRKIWVSVALLAIVIGARLLGWEPETASAPPVRAEPAIASSSEARSRSELERLIDERRSGVMVEAEGRVAAVLADDQRGSRHQRLLVELASGATVLIAHNVDLAARVANVQRGDRLAFRGQYEWNEKGGVIHWTHHDPDRRHDEGWLRHEGKTYR